MNGLMVVEQDGQLRQPHHPDPWALMFGWSVAGVNDGVEKVMIIQRYWQAVTMCHMSIFGG